MPRLPFPSRSPRLRVAVESERDPLPPPARGRIICPMAKPLTGRHTAELDGDFVVFLIGARFDLRHPIRTFQDLGGRRGMSHMLKYLTEHPEKGLLGYEMGLPTIVQYWRSYEHLE